jgi:hypothetical protein
MLCARELRHDHDADVLLGALRRALFREGERELEAILTRRVVRSLPHAHEALMDRLAAEHEPRVLAAAAWGRLCDEGQTDRADELARLWAPVTAALLVPIGQA